MTFYGTAESHQLHRAVLANPSNETLRLAMTDWLLEQGEPETVAATCEPMQRSGPCDIYTFLIGSFGFGSGSGGGFGSGFGNGFGSGSGFGSGGGFGSGFGSGGGFGSGFGSGNGSGFGRGSGRGSGFGSGSGFSQYEDRHLEPGKAYLMHCGDWHTFVGRVVRQTAPFTYLFESVSKIADTRNGDCWEKLAAGDEQLRKAADYRHYTTPAILPLTIAAVEWTGGTPQEAGL